MERAPIHPFRTAATYAPVLIAMTITLAPMMLAQTEFAQIMPLYVTTTFHAQPTNVLQALVNTFQSLATTVMAALPIPVAAYAHTLP